MKKKILLVGAGGHATSCLDILEEIDEYQIIGFIDSKKKGNKFNYKILGDYNEIKDLFLKKKVSHAFVTIGQIKDYKPRLETFQILKSIGFVIPVIISKHSFVSKRAEIGEGTIVMNGVTISGNVKIGKNCIINSNSLIEHDTIIGDNCHISTSVTINGNCRIHSNSFIGSSSTISNGVKIKENSIIKIRSIIF